MKRYLFGAFALMVAGILIPGQVSAAELKASLNGYMEQWFGFNGRDRDVTDGPTGALAEFTATDFNNDGAGRFRTPFMSSFGEIDSSCNDDKRLTYFTPRFSGFQFGGSYTANCGSQDTNALGTDATIENVLSFGANYKRKIERFDLGLSVGYQRGEESAGNTGDDSEVLALGARIGFEGFTLGGYYGNTLDAMHNTADTADNEIEGFGVGASYETGPWDVSLTYLHGAREGTIAASDEDETDTIHLGAQYKLGPGVNLSGSVGWVDWQSESGAAGEFDNEGWFVVGGMKVSF